MTGTPARLSESPLLAVVHGASGLFIGIGLARFSFTPLIPLLIRDNWYTVTEAQLLGAWGLAGYLLGGLAAQRLARLLAPSLLSGLMATCIVLSFLICSFPVSYPVASFWRLAANFAGAVLMIAGTAEASARLNDMGAGSKAGILFTGVGAGAVVSALLMPVFGASPVGQASLALTMISALTLVVHLWAGMLLPARPRRHLPGATPHPGHARKPILLVIFAYGMDAVGGTPHAVYLVDYATREIGLSAGWGSLAWASFGFGAMAGPLVLGRHHPRMAFVAFLAKAACVALVSLTSWPPAFVISAFTVGFCTPGIAVLVAKFIQGAAEPLGFIRSWAWATIIFALMQAASAFIASWISVVLQSYRLVFLVSSIALVTGAVAYLAAARTLEGR